MKSTIALIALALAACAHQPTPAEQAVRQYEIVKRTDPANSALRCTAATNVADAYLQEENEVQYRQWHVLARIECSDPSLGG